MEKIEIKIRNGERERRSMYEMDFKSLNLNFKFKSQKFGVENCEF